MREESRLLGVGSTDYEEVKIRKQGVAEALFLLEMLGAISVEFPLAIEGHRTRNMHGISTTEGRGRG